MKARTMNHRKILDLRLAGQSGYESDQKSLSENKARLVAISFADAKNNLQAPRKFEVPFDCKGHREDLPMPLASYLALRH